MLLRHCWFALSFMTTLAFLGAGCKPGVEMAPVKGTVTYNGKPLAKGTILFEPTGQRSATGKIVDGEIVEVTTYKSGDGAVVGPHKVAIFSTEEPASGGGNPGDASKPNPDYMTGKSLIPAHYSDITTSGLTADIQSGENTVTFTLTSAPAKGAK